MSERLRHYTSKPLEEIRSSAQEGIPGAYSKPRGFWVSVLGEDDWPSWCESEKFREIDRQFEYEISIASDANILRMYGAGELDAFTRQYGFEHKWGSYTDQCINWQAVARDYQGAIIAPYVWARRLELNWYYGWDCASGCIWDATAISGTTLLREPSEEAA